MKNQYQVVRETPRPFGERFKESYHNCPADSLVLLCPCGNSFHNKEWSKNKYCSQVCVLRYFKDEAQIKTKIKEAQLV